MKKKQLLPMHLQYFAEPGADPDPNGADPSGGQGGNGSEGGSDGGSGEPSNKTFTRDDVSKMIAAETAKAVKEAQEQWQHAKDEADKVAKMNEEEKAKHVQAQLQAEIDSLKQEKTMSNMRETARGILAESGIANVDEALELVVFDDADTTKTKIDALKKIVDANREAIKAEYEQKLGGRVPTGGASHGTEAGAFGKQLAQSSKAPTPKKSYFNN